MENKRNHKGISLMEVCVVIAVMAVIIAIGFPSFSAYYRTYKFHEYAYAVESLIKSSKLVAMEKSINVGVCVDIAAKTLSIVNMEANRSNICSGPILNTLRVDDAFVSLSASGTMEGTKGLSFDPRGFAIYPGHVCASNGVKYYKVVVGRFGATRIERGSGGCP